MSGSKIEWTDYTWNPVTGCTPVSEGCRNCYAARMAKRLAGRAGYPADEPFRVTLHQERLGEPLRWKRPGRVFVCSMGDLFHDDVPPRFIDDVLRVIIQCNIRCKNHTFLILTKRPERMARHMSVSRVLQNLWLGMSIEDQATADERIPWLMRTPAAKRFVSYEPALGPVDLRAVKMPDGDTLGVALYNHGENAGLDLVIAGGETGPGARPAHPDWFRSVRDQCQAAGVAFFFKSWGEWVGHGQEPSDNYPLPIRDGNQIHFWPEQDTASLRVGPKRAGRLLDGREWNEWPTT